MFLWLKKKVKKWNLPIPSWLFSFTRWYKRNKKETAIICLVLLISCSWKVTLVNRRFWTAEFSSEFVKCLSSDSSLDSGCCLEPSSCLDSGCCSDSVCSCLDSGCGLESSSCLDSGCCSDSVCCLDSGCGLDSVCCLDSGCRFDSGCGLDSVHLFFSIFE